MTTAQNELQMSSTAYATAWTTTPADYDIVASDPIKGAVPGLANPSEGRPSRWIICGGTGTLVVKRLDGTNVTLDAVFAGQRFDVQAINLVASGTTATKVSVYW